MSKKLFDGPGVLLVGAGPGDPDLLTLKAVKALGEADVALFDDLVSPAVLELVRQGATRLSVGKRAGRPSWAQDDINNLMIRLVEKGKRVVRLKAGDPSIFGRAGEEMEALSRAGVPVAIVPGITTASALGASLRVSMTHRACAQSVRFVTAHGAKGGLPQDLHWAGLADVKTTLIVYMGRKTGADLAQKLMENGRCPSTPLVIVSNVSRASEQQEVGTLGSLADMLASWKDDGPLVIAIGEVFAKCLAQATPPHLYTQSA